MDGLNILPSEGYSRTVGTTGWQPKGVADLDGDAKADVVWRNAITGENYLWPMEGLAINPSEGYFRTVDLSWQIAAIRDYDGDLRADIFWRRGQDQQPSREYVYLGDMPVAAFLSGSPIPHYIHVDHLNTPRLVANAAQQTVWRWDQQEPFGANLPDENPSGLGTFEFPLRFPGQYFDRETNVHYNYYRDYDPAIGRYVQSDPLGLVAGLNTYAYVKSDPLARMDPSGLKARICCRKIPRWYVLAYHCFVDEVVDSTCGNCMSITRRVGLHGPYPYGNSQYKDRGEIRTNDDFDKPGESRCGEWNTDCGTSGCISAEESFYPNPSTYSAVGGPNSNTFAAAVAQSCNLAAPTIFLPAWGWHDTPPTR